MNKILFIAIILLQACSQTPSQEESKVVDEVVIEYDQPCINLSQTETRDGLLVYNEEPFTGKVCSYFPGGGKHTETSFLNGLKEGEWKVYYANGNLEKKGILSDGKDNGEYLEYYENGELKYEYHYESGQKIGVWKSWYENGKKYTERNFSNNILHGKVLVWDEQGRLAKEYDYLHGKLVNKQMHFKDWE